ncbi:MAG TPA: hypothetical protein VN253_14020 [Kofleriaceae bacterium]|nr:hypothetical protein [Kofleriaceae bacterium]
MQATSVSLSGYANARNKAALRHYFEYSGTGLEVVEDLPEIHFGEYLVEQGLIDRYQLFRALQLQDRTPGIRLGVAVAMLGYAPASAIERQYGRFQELATIDVDA